eukprot:7602212-Pyramimonas_sp.AAC.1
MAGRQSTPRLGGGGTQNRRGTDIGTVWYASNANTSYYIGPSHTPGGGILWLRERCRPIGYGERCRLQAPVRVQHTHRRDSYRGAVTGPAA